MVNSSQCSLSLPTCLWYSHSLPTRLPWVLWSILLLKPSVLLFSFPEPFNLFNRMLFENDLNRGALPYPASLKYHFLIPGHFQYCFVCVHMHMLRRALATDYNLGCLSLPYTLFEIGSLLLHVPSHLAWMFLVMLSLLFHYESIRVADIHPLNAAFLWVLGIWTQVTMLAWQMLLPSSHFSTLMVL